MNRQQIAYKLSALRYRLRAKIQRYREALAYARNRIDSTQANSIIHECQATAGWYPLEVLSGFSSSARRK